jgi:hypothetical protein
MRLSHPAETGQRVFCPRCGAPVSINLPDAIAAAVPPLPVSAVASLAQESGAPPPAPHRGLVLLCVFGGLILLVGISVGLAWYFSFDGKPKGPPVDRHAHDGTGRDDPDRTTDSDRPKSPPEPPLPPDPRIKIVQPNIDKGVAYLKTSVPQLASLRAGYAGLDGLALLECDVPPDDPAILRIAEIIRAAAPAMNLTYDLAASLFFLNCWDERRPKGLDENDRKLARTLALRIIAGQLSTGIWSYGGVIMTPAQEKTLLTALQDGTYKPNGPVVTGPSMSNTQFAMLAVWGARKHGVPVRDSLLALANYFHNDTQQKEGSWNYPGNSLKATSTCAGLIALAIEEVLLHDDEFTSKNLKPAITRKKADVNKAFEFVAKTIGRTKGDPGAGTSLGYGGALFDADAMGDLYFLWTLERVGVIYSTELIGGKRWYDWGYPIVQKSQQPDGSWSEKHRLSFGPLIDTPFALLFLKRANIAKDLTAKLQIIIESKK